MGRPIVHTEDGGSVLYWPPGIDGNPGFIGDPGSEGIWPPGGVPPF